MLCTPPTSVHIALGWLGRWTTVALGTVVDGNITTVIGVAAIVVGAVVVSVA